MSGSRIGSKIDIRVDSRDAEFFMLKSKTRIPRGRERQDQPCADGMVGMVGGTLSAVQPRGSMGMH